MEGKKAALVLANREVVAIPADSNWEDQSSQQGPQMTADPFHDRSSQDAPLNSREPSSRCPQHNYAKLVHTAALTLKLGSNDGLIVRLSPSSIFSLAFQVGVRAGLAISFETDYARRA